MHFAWRTLHVIIRRDCGLSLSANRGRWHTSANERLHHAHPGAGMLTVAAPSGIGGTPAAVTDGGGRADMRRASIRLTCSGTWLLRWPSDAPLEPGDLYPTMP